MSGFALLLAVSLVFLKMTGGFDFTSGLATLGVLMLFFTGCQFIGLGVLGAYIGRIYEETKGRPKFIVEDAIGFDEIKKRGEV
jgi:dolichol-phosphate mannosyltransferase